MRRSAYNDNNALAATSATPSTLDSFHHVPYDHPNPLTHSLTHSRKVPLRISSHTRALEESLVAVNRSIGPTMGAVQRGCHTVAQIADTVGLSWSDCASGGRSRRPASCMLHAACCMLRVACCVLHVGLSWSLIADSLWAASGTLLLGSYLCATVIPREEAYMRAHFGAAYDEYCSRVRRWLPCA